MVPAGEVDSAVISQPAVESMNGVEKADWSETSDHH